MKVLYVIFVALIIVRVGSINYSYPEGARIRIQGRVLTEPVVYERARYIKLKGLKAYVELFPEVNYGDSITLEGDVEGDKLKNAKYSFLTNFVNSAK